MCRIEARIVPTQYECEANRTHRRAPAVGELAATESVGECCVDPDCLSHSHCEQWLSLAELLVSQFVADRGHHGFGA
jgi:hypothetical protein